jgi:cold-inducible RNA-binding protein
VRDRQGFSVTVHDREGQESNRMGKRLYVGNLPYSVTEADLREVFSQAGDIDEVKVMLDRETGRPRGFAFVEMATPNAATTAIDTLNGRDLQGRAMNVKEAQERTGGGGGGGGGRGNWSGGGDRGGWSGGGRY